jgi:hypothetical protein
MHRGFDYYLQWIHQTPRANSLILTGLRITSQFPASIKNFEVNNLLTHLSYLPHMKYLTPIEEFPDHRMESSSPWKTRGFHVNCNWMGKVKWVCFVWFSEKQVRTNTEFSLNERGKISQDNNINKYIPVFIKIKLLPGINMHAFILRYGFPNKKNTRRSHELFLKYYLKCII